MRNYRGFTKVGCVVACAIAVIAAAILFPIFARQREKPGHYSCESNVKQIGLGMLQYEGDYDDILPPGSRVWASSTIMPYIKTVQVFECPSVSLYGTHYDYGLNSIAAGQKVTRMDSKKTIVLFESIRKDTGQEALGTSTVGDLPVRDRHLDGAIFGFADGHVRWLPQSAPLESAAVTFGLNNVATGKKK